MGSDKFDEGYLTSEVESGDQAIIPSCDLEPDALAIQYLGPGSRFLDFICRGPVRGSNELVPAFERCSGLGVVSMFPKWEHKLGIRRIPADQPWTESRAETAGLKDAKTLLDSLA